MAEPRSVGPYTLERELGRGNYGAVYLARHGDLQRPVALKVLLVRGDKTAEARFEREARVASRLNHPNIVGCFDIGRDAKHDALYLAMDYVEGRTLKERLAEGTLGIEEATALGTEVASALAHAHEQDVVHRDLKPANIILDADGRPHVTDFGLARDLADGAGNLTTAGFMVGSPHYMAPEQTTGEPVDARVDVYALGAILYQSLTGKKPIEGEGIERLIHRIRTGKIERPSRLRPDLPFALERLILHALARKPEDRFKDGAELFAALSEVDLLSTSSLGAGRRSLPARSLLGLSVAAMAVLVVLIALVATQRSSSNAEPAAPDPIAAATPTDAPTPTAPPDVNELSEAALEALIERDPKQPEPYLALIRLHTRAWRFRAAESLIPRARSYASGPTLELAVEELRSLIRRERAEEKRASAALEARYRDSLDAPGAIARAQKYLERHPGSVLLRRRLVRLHGVAGDYFEGRRLLDEILAQTDPPDERDRTNREFFAELAKLAKPGKPPAGWLPLEGGHWTLEPDGSLRGALIGIGEFGFCGRIAADCPSVSPPRTVSVEMKFKPGEQDAFAGLMIAVQDPGTMVIAYPFQNAKELKRMRRLTGERWEKGFRMAFFRRGRWEHLATVPVTFGDDWFKLELKLTETGVVPTLDGTRLQRVPLAVPPSGRIGVMKFYETTACFRNLRWK